MSEHKDTIYLIIEYLNGLKEAGISADTVDTVTGLLEAEFDLSISPENFTEYSAFPVTLPELIKSGKQTLGVQQISASLEEAKSDPKFVAYQDSVVALGYYKDTTEGSLEYLQRSARLLNKYRSRIQATAGPSQAELEKQAEDWKVKGNASISSKDYQGAIKNYSEAIRLSPEGPSSHVFYCNRAAAYCHTNEYQLAVDDCLSSITLNADYVKAYSRLGLAYYWLEKYQDAVDAYERAAEIEPDNKATQDSLRQARNKLKKSQQKSAVASSSSAASAPADIPGMPNMAGLMGNPAMKRALDQMGGPSALGNLMKDPQMMAMAQQMMKDPAMMQQAMAMLGGGGAGGDGGFPDMSALAGMMGGLGGMGGAPPSSSSVPSSSSGKKKFTGFEE